MLDSHNLFKNEILSSLIFHIPHASTVIPIDINYNEHLIQNELMLLTDYATDEIFNVSNTDKIIPNFSRIFCDVERLPDNIEPMFQYGRGFYYTKTDDGQVLRDDTLKDFVHKYYYLPHFDKLNNLVTKKLQENGSAYIIDCHSFSNTPLMSDLEKNKSRPDICIGTDNDHTPQFLIDLIKLAFENYGYSVELNYPYSGTMIPTIFQNNKNVYGIMIEINKKLYMKNNIVIHHNVTNLNKIINSIFS